MGRSRINRNKKTEFKVSENKRKKLVSINQNVIIEDVIHRSEFNSKEEFDFSSHSTVAKIYATMMQNANKINRKLTKKNLEFYKWGLGYLDSERTIQKKRNDLIEFILKEKERKRLEIRQSRSNRRRKRRVSNEVEIIDLGELGEVGVERGGSVNCDGRKKAEIEVEVEERTKELKLAEEVGNKEESVKEVIELNEESVDAEKSSDFEIVTENKDENLSKSTENVNEEIKDFGSKSIEIEIEDNSVIEGRAGERDAVSDQVFSIKLEKVDVVDEDSTCRNSLRSDKSVESVQEIKKDGEDESSSSVEERRGMKRELPHNKFENRKIRRREVVDLCDDDEEEDEVKSRKHDLVDKLLLGISCHRQWTSKGLQLRRIPDIHLSLLRKRCQSIDCSFSDLCEQRDDNNNVFISVVLQCALFEQHCDTTQPLKNEPEPSYLPMHLHKNRQYVPNFYRSRNTLPSILSKPLASSKIHNNSSTNISQKPPGRISQPNLINLIKTDRLPFSQNSEQPKNQIITATLHSLSSSASPVIINKPHQTTSLTNMPLTTVTTPLTTSSALHEPLPTASQLLKLKSRALLTNKIQNISSHDSATTATIINASQAPIFYRPPSTIQHTILIPPNARLIPLTKAHTISSQSLTPTSTTPTTSTATPSQSAVILKTLLQQQQHRITNNTFKQPIQLHTGGVGSTTAHPLAASMMSLSAFQSARNAASKLYPISTTKFVRKA